MLNKQLEFETTYSKKNIREWVLEDLASDPLAQDILTKCEVLIANHLGSTDTFYTSKKLRYMMVKRYEPRDIALDVLTAVLSITTGTMPVVAVGTTIGLNYHEDRLNAVKTGVELLGVLEPLDIYTITAGYIDEDGTTSSFLTPNFTFDNDLLHKIHTTMYLPPMLTQPLDWEDNATGGHYVHSDQCILGSNNYHTEYQALDVLNELQHIAWKFTDIINLEEPDAKPRKLGEEAREYNKRVMQYNLRREHSRYVYDLMEDTFYFVWKYDKRGRIYSSGYDINLQGSEYKKASIEFANEELIKG